MTRDLIRSAAPGPWVFACGLLVIGCSASLDEPTEGGAEVAPGSGGSSELESMQPPPEGSGAMPAAGGMLGATGGAPASGGQVEPATGGVVVTGGTGGTEMSDQPEPLGDGWEEYFPDFDYHLPPPSNDYGERYTYENGEWHLWVEDSDPSSFPGQDSGPRSEVRVRNEYSSGKRQFQGDVMLLEGAERVGIWQLFKRPYPWMIRVYDGEYRQFGNGSSFGEVPFGQWQRFYAIHDADAETLQIYIDGELVVDENIGGSEIDYYNKFGVYGREGMGELNEIFWKNVHYFRSE